MFRIVPKRLHTTCLSIATLLLLARAPALAAQVPADSVYDLSAVETGPRPVNLGELRNALQRSYPPEKRAAGVGARVQVAFVLGSNGVPRNVAVRRSTDAAFDSVTMAAVSLLRFTPAQVGGKPVPVRLELPIQWMIADDDPPAGAATSASTSVPLAPNPRAAEARADSLAAMDLPRVYSLTEVDPQPRPTNSDALRRELLRRYPNDLHAAGAQATVQVRFVVTERGQVGPARVTHSTDPRFDAATLQAIKVLRFRPGRDRGQAVPTWVELPIFWTP